VGISQLGRNLIQLAVFASLLRTWKSSWKYFPPFSVCRPVEKKFIVKQQVQAS